MQNLLYLSKGLIVGFFTAVPIGPIGIMCIQLSISSGKKHGFASGLGAATADMLFGGIAIFGITMISSFVLDNNAIIRSIGGIILIPIGISILISKQKNKEIDIKKGSVLYSYFSTFLLTFTNPMTIIAYIPFLAVLDIANTTTNIISSSFVVAGIFLGSTLWFVLLTTLAQFLKRKLSEKSLHNLNKILGVIIISFALFLLIKHILF